MTFYEAQLLQWWLVWVVDHLPCGWYHPPDAPPSALTPVHVLIRFELVVGSHHAAKLLRLLTCVLRWSLRRRVHRHRPCRCLSSDQHKVAVLFLSKY